MTEQCVSYLSLSSFFVWQTEKNISFSLQTWDTLRSQEFLLSVHVAWCHMNSCKASSLWERLPPFQLCVYERQFAFLNKEIQLKIWTDESCRIFSAQCSKWLLLFSHTLRFGRFFTWAKSCTQAKWDHGDSDTIWGPILSQYPVTTFMSLPGCRHYWFDFWHCLHVIQYVAKCRVIIRMHQQVCFVAAKCTTVNVLRTAPEAFLSCTPF